MAFTKEQAVGFGITFDTDTPTQEEIDEKVSKRLTELAGENSKLHSTISKVNSENAEYKRKANEKLTAEEQQNARIKELEESNAKWEKQFAKSNKVNDYLGIGYPKDLAEQIADAEIEGKPTAALHQKFVQAREEALKKELMVKNPAPKVNGDDDFSDLTKEKFDKLPYSEKLKLQEKNPTLFEKYRSKK